MGRSIVPTCGGEFLKNSSEDAGMPMPVMAGDSSRLVVLHGDVTEQSISMIVAQLLHLSSLNHKPIHFVISTYGGSVDEMFTLYDTIKFLPCPVHTIGLGKIMSAGVLLLSSGQKGKRMLGKSSRIMMHSVSGGVSGNVFEVMNDAKEHKRLHDQMVSALAKETGNTLAKIEKIMERGIDHYILPDDAIKLGIVDKIIGDDKKK